VILSFLTTPCRAASAGHTVSNQKKKGRLLTRRREDLSSPSREK